MGHPPYSGWPIPPGYTMFVRDLMSAPVFTIKEDKHLRAVEEIMNWAHIRHVPVVTASGRLVGIISHRDLLAAAVSSLAVKISQAERAQHLAASDVRHLMHKPIETIGPDETVQRAAHLMRRHKIGCLPVVERDRLVGIITEADLLGIVEGLSDEAVGRF
jgi:CBS domain-containing membrane protein